jgi:hypothetical protein
MDQISIQYLEGSPDLDRLTASPVADKLLRAGDILPINNVLLGWHLPLTLYEACRKATDQIGADLYRWHPLLTSDSSLRIYPQWQTIGLDGDRVPGYKGKPEFTFICPNHPEVQEAVQEHIDRIIRKGGYEGLFLDRIRYPSPAWKPDRNLACFCEHCRAKAEAENIDMNETRRILARWAGTREGKRDLVVSLLQKPGSAPISPEAVFLQSFLDFRCKSITNFAQLIVDQIHSAGLQAGLDCYPPGLARMVGQDLRALDGKVEWIKLMTYAHTFGEGGFPYEILGLVEWLTSHAIMTGEKALDLFSETLELSLPSTPELLKDGGISPVVLQELILRGTRVAKSKILAGIELVEIDGIVQLEPNQIEEDLEAVRSANPAGLVLSWDLWKIPFERLEIVSKFWYD